MIFQFSMENSSTFLWVKDKKIEPKKPYLMQQPTVHGSCYKMYILCSHGWLV